MNDLRLDQTLEALLQESRAPAPHGQQSEAGFATPALQNFRAAFPNASAADRIAAVQRIAEALPRCQPLGAARLAVFCGALVEEGHDPSLTAPVVAEYFRHQLAFIASVIDSLPEDAEPPADISILARGEQREAIQSHRFLCPAVVSHLAASSELRAALSQDAAFMTRLKKTEGVLPATGWVCEILAKCNGEILVLAPTAQQGFLVAYRNLSNCFHLFTLLQETLAPHFRIDLASRASVIAMARGDKDVHQDASDSAIWTYCDCRGLDKKVTLVWGEMSPAEIPQFEGMPIVLLLSGGPQRTWGAGFFGPQLRQCAPTVEIIQLLARKKVLEWCERLKNPTAASNPGIAIP